MTDNERQAALDIATLKGNTECRKALLEQTTGANEQQSKRARIF